MNILFALVTFIQIPQYALGGGYIEIDFKTYNTFGRDSAGDSCDPGGGDCDAYFEFCLDNPKSNDNNVETCQYGYKKTNKHYHNRNIVDFHNEYSTSRDGTLTYMGVPNPWKREFPTWPGGVYLKVRAKDDDSWTGDDTIDHNRKYIIVSKPGSYQVPVAATLMISGRRVKQPTHLNLDYKVYCALNYYGPNCTTLCVPENGPVHYYTCNPNNGSWICLHGWEGPKCDIPVNDCNPNKCQNRGICIDGYNSYTCDCRQGYTGPDCEVDINECDPNPCNGNGQCLDLVGTYECKCTAGYVTDNCAYHVCHPNNTHCLNGGTCYDLPGQGEHGKCLCPPSYTGQNCELDLCDGNPCKNNGTCIDGKCVCPPGITGALCSVDLCDHIRCHNGGTCVQGKCSCPTGYDGERCEINVDGCKDKPCKNNGTCKDLLDGKYECICPLWIYEGAHCDIKVQAQTSSDKEVYNTTVISKVRIHDKDNTGLIIGLIGGLLALILIITILICLLLRNRRKKNAANASTNTTNDTQTQTRHLESSMSTNTMTTTATGTEGGMTNFDNPLYTANHPGTQAVGTDPMNHQRNAGTNTYSDVPFGGKKGLPLDEPNYTDLPEDEEWGATGFTQPPPYSEKDNMKNGAIANGGIPPSYEDDSFYSVPKPQSAREGAPPLPARNSEKRLNNLDMYDVPPKKSGKKPNLNLNSNNNNANDYEEPQNMKKNLVRNDSSTYA